MQSLLTSGAVMHQFVAMYDYLSQMRDEANRLDIDLIQAVKSAGIPTSTYWRWMNGVAPTEALTRRVLDAMYEGNS
tara:strand:+ start:5573 stop:5800 length:228 start_codon:yes stop_codon:yes gene_type:complete